MARLSSRQIEGLKSSENSRIELSDDAVRGLYLRVSPSGVKSWMFRYTREDGTRAKFGLGRFPAIGLADARELALKATVKVTENRDPARERRRERAKARRGTKVARTLADLWALYDRDVMPSKRATTSRYQRWLWRKHLAKRLGPFALIEIDRALVRQALNEIKAAGGTTANRALALVRHMLNVAIDLELLQASPIARMARPAKEHTRNRVLRDAEIRRLWWAVEVAPGSKLHISSRVCAALKLVLMTGARGIEVVGLRAEEIDVAGRLWTIPADRFKGKRPHTVPLTSIAMELLEEAFGCPPTEWQGFAFPNMVHQDRHMERMTLTRAMQEIVAAAGIERATPHDLRRTVATFMASERIGVPPHVVGAVLGHAAEGAAVTRIYNRHSYDKEKRTALDAWADVLVNIIGSEPVADGEAIEFERIDAKRRRAITKRAA